MRHSIIVITNKQKILIVTGSIALILLIALFMATVNFPNMLKTTTSGFEPRSAFEDKNASLNSILTSIVPTKDKILFEGPNRNISDTSQPDLSKIRQASEVILKGSNLNFIVVYEDPGYLRPIYSDTWKQAHFRGWLYLPDKIVSSRHSLFAYDGSVGNKFELEGQLGFYPNVEVDTQNHINFLIYNFELENIALYGDQLAISGIPLKKGVQIISVKTEEVSALTGNAESITAQLCTPAGYELDFQTILLPSSNANSGNNENEHETFEENLTDSNPPALYEQGDMTKILNYYISSSASTIYFQHNGSYQTSDVLNTNIDIYSAIQNSTLVKHKIVFSEENYLRPVYHPLWKKNYDKEWCYIPRKMYLNMKRLFTLPADENITKDLLGELGFFEEYDTIGNDQTGLLIYNFTIQSIQRSENNLLVIGSPARTGIQIITVPKAATAEFGEYAVRLITKDFCELDMDVIKK